ncbi:MAG: four helix bundle protein [Thermoguttaceae bacterium]
MSIRDFTELLVWQKAVELVEMVYRVTKQFPHEELYGLTGQFRRAAVSVPANVAEGHGRQSTRDYLRVLSISRGSLKEVETHIFIAERLGYIDIRKKAELLQLTAEVGRLSAGLITSLKRKNPEHR